MTHLDTDILIWLYEGQGNRLSKAARNLMRRSPSLAVSPLTLMEIDNLIAGRRVKASTPQELMAAVSDDFGLVEISPTRFDHIVFKALTIGWTRDPFDRLIVANAMADRARLITADEKIRAHFADAVW